jgi:hypothetical protein
MDILASRQLCPEALEVLMDFAKDGHLEASNNFAECCVRLVAIGRKACLFVASEGEHAAAVNYSLVESYKANQVTPRRT